MKTTLIAASLFLLSAATFAKETRATKTPESCQKFVQEFYDWYVPMQEKERKTFAYYEVLDKKKHLLNTELFNALKGDREAQKIRSYEIVALDYDPFLNAQDSDSKYVAENASITGDRCIVDLRSPERDPKKSLPPQVSPVLEFKNGKWLFADITNKDPGTLGKSLLETLKNHKEDRESQKKKK